MKKRIFVVFGWKGHRDALAWLYRADLLHASQNKMKSLEVLFTPADFAALDRRNLDHTLCVVFDIFRATSSMITALANGAAAVIPVGEIAEALEIRGRDPQVLLAGERDGLRIRAQQTGGIDFDLGNSPIEFTCEKVVGKTIVTTTTNGTRALRACARAKTVLVGSFLNLKATADWIVRERPENLLLVCSGTFEQTAYEDVLAAGAMCDALWDECSDGEISDSALIARRLYQVGKMDLADVAASSRNGRRLQNRPSLKDDIRFCLQQDVFNFTAALQKDGRILRLARGGAETGGAT